MGLLPLEYSDCLTDTPHYRENLRAHEKELERTSQAIKGLIKEVKDLLTASKTLSKAQRSLATTLINFRFDCIGCSLTDDEIVIAGSLKEFGRLLCVIEDERDRMLNRAEETLIKPIEDFRKENIGAAKEGKKKFDKETARYCQSLERRLNLSTKKNGSLIQEVDASLELEQRHFFNASLDYALLLTEIQEKKKFEFVETILSFMGGMMTFYHQGYEVANEYKPYMNDLQRRIQRTRENFKATHSEAEQLKQRTLEKNQDPGILNKMYTRQGYLFLMEKKALSTTWTKHFCQYQKSQKKFSMMPYSQTTGKISNGETITIKECFRRQCDTIDKRFCFDVIAEDRPPCTFQAMSDEDCRQWLDAMDGNEPTFNTPGKSSKSEEFALDDLGFDFVRWCINYVESRGLTDQGLYRLVGVNSKVSKLTQMALDKRNYHALSGDDEWEIKTVTSALKNFFRNLPEPLLSFRLHGAFITAAKQENKVLRINSVHSLVHTLPNPNFRMLEILIKHLCKIAKLAEKNLMTVSNLGVCFGPTLLRSEEETLAAIIDIKFGNVVVEILIENCEKIFGSTPELNGARRPSRPPPYVSPPRPLRRELPAEYRTSMGHSAVIRNPAPENYSNRVAPPQSSYLTNSSQVTFSSSPHPVVTEDQKSHGLIIYNPVWSDGPSLSTDNCSTFTGPPLPEQETSGLYPAPWPDIHRAESISVHRLSNTDIGDKGCNREFYSSTEVLPETVCGQVTNQSSHTSGRRVRTLYACRGENDMELSFEPNEIICNVQFSQEPGWIHGTLRGKTGLIPRNYVTFIP